MEHLVGNQEDKQSELEKETQDDKQDNQPEPETEIQEDEQNSHPELERASTWIRLWGFLIDHVIIVILLVPLFARGVHFGSLLFLLFLFLGLLLYAIKDIVKGQSPGKYILGIAVRSQADTSEMPSAKKLFLRNLFVFLWPIDFLILVFSKIKIGDRLAKTNVYRLSKKPRVIIRLAVALAIIILLVLLVHAQIGLGSRTPLCAEEFSSRMEEAGYTVEDITYRFTENHHETIEVVLTAESEFFNMEFAVFSTEASARQMFAANESHLEAASRGMMTSSNWVSISNFSRLAKTFDGRYIVLSRIENTMVIANTSSRNRGAMDDLLRTLGY
jgi:uncharacterized RDD family membrane protein YckC